MGSITPDKQLFGKPIAYSTAISDFLKYSMLTMSGPISVLGGGAGLLGAGVLGVHHLSGLFGLSAVGATGFAGWKARDFLGLTEKSEKFRRLNPTGARGIKEFWLHMGMSTLTNVVLFSNIAADLLAYSSGAAMAVRFLKRGSYRSGAGGFVGALSSPLYNLALSGLIAAARQLDDEEDSKNDLYKDLMRIYAATFGLGATFVMTSLLAALEAGEDNRLPGRRKSTADGPLDDVVDMVSPAVGDQFVDMGKILDRAWDEGGDFLDWATKKPPLYSPSKDY